MHKEGSDRDVWMSFVLLALRFCICCCCECLQHMYCKSEGDVFLISLCFVYLRGFA